jgi:ribonuclease D
MENNEAITYDELKDLPLRTFPGEIVLLNNYEQARHVANELAAYPILGFDTETRPSFKKGNTNKVALLQLSTDNKAYIFRLNQYDLPLEILKILSDPNIIKAGVAIRDDIKALKSNRHFLPEGFVELQDVAKEKGLNSFSLKKLSGLVLGFRISKAQQLSNWEANELTEAQLQYAATDAWVSYLIYKTFKNGFHG